MSKVSKKQRVVNALVDHGSISPFYAFNHLGETRLAATIFKLKKEGYKIDTQIENGKNKFGDEISFAKYILVEQPS
tara:strand:+ start:22018 stop:22245 length:228 start_codon:yes stop_codon:yes gene_type:complete